MASQAEIEKLWEDDSRISKDCLDVEALKIPELHNKYYKLFMNEKALLGKEEKEYKVLYKEKWEYYSGKLSVEECKSKNWEPMDLIILKGDVQIYLDADHQLGEKLILINARKEKVLYLQNIINTLNNRSFIIKNAIDWLRFVNGG